MGAKFKRLMKILAALHLAALLGAGPAASSGPFTHLEFARQYWPAAAAELGLADQARELFPAVCAGALAPSAGYYLPGGASLADAMHLIKAGEMTSALMRMAQTPREKAFAVGWLGHANLSRLEFGNALNMLANGTRSEKPREHLKLQWGLDSTVLERPSSAWMWDLKIDMAAGLDLWARAMKSVYGVAPPKEFLQKAMQAQAAELAELPRYFWLAGKIWRPGHYWGNLLGAAIGHSMSPAYLAWLSWSGASPGQEAILAADRTLSLGAEVTTQLHSLAQAQVLALLTGDRMPPGNLFSDQSCNLGECAQAKQAAEWLAGLK